MSKDELEKILAEYQQYEIDLMEAQIAEGAPRPVQHHFSFARFFNWIMGLEQS